MARQPEPWRRSQGGDWYAWVNGRQRKLADAGRPKAEAWEALRLMRAEEGRAEKVVAARLMSGEVFRLWLAAVERRVEQGEASAGSLDRYVSFLESAEAAFGRVAARDLTPAAVQAWLDAHPTWGPTTANHAVGTVKAAFNWARRVGHLDGEPLSGLAKPAARRRNAVMTAVQFAALLAAIPDRPFRDLVVALRETGARPNEVITLTADRVDLAAERWTVVNKTRRATGEPWRTVYLSAAALDLSRRLVAAHAEGPVFRTGRGTPWTATTMGHRFVRVRTPLGFGEECCAYALRHLFITDALERGVPPATVAELVGHSDLKMIMRVYNQLRSRTGHLREAVRAIRPGAPPASPDTP